ncbi:MarR family transcriptional regulator [bacterium]|nr:MarR family transcriptional regulator [bacterium]
MSLSQDARTVLGLINLNSKVHRRLGGALSVHGLGVSELLVLIALREAPSRTMRRVDLAERVGLTASGITRLLNPLEKVGLVEKTQGARDARVSLVALSAGGQRMLEDVEVAVNDTAKSLLAPLDRRRQRELNGLTQALS